MLIEPVRMNTLEPFSIKSPFNKIKDIGGNVIDKTKDVGEKVVDKGKDIGGDIVDKGKDIGGKVVDVGKDIGGKVADVGKKIGGVFVTIGQTLGAVFSKAFKGLLNFFMFLFKNWKIALSLAVTCLVCYLLMPFLLPIMRIFSFK